MKQDQSITAYLNIRNRTVSCIPSLLLFSFAINLLMLAGPMFMLQVYDRVIPTGSVPTLIGLFVLVGFLYLFLALFEMTRSRVLSQLGLYIDSSINDHTTHGGLKKQNILASNRTVVRQQADRLRHFLSGGGPEPFLDLPFLPIYVLCICLLHPYLMVTPLLGIALLAVTSFLNIRLSKPHVEAAGKYGEHTNQLSAEYESHGTVANVLGFGQNLLSRMFQSHQQFLVSHQKKNNRTQIFRALSKGLRPLVQSMTLAIGAFLVVQNELTAGSMIAASVMAGRLLQPVDSAINALPECLMCWKAFSYLREHANHNAEMETKDLLRFRGKLEVQNLTVLDKAKKDHGLAKPVLKDINFSLNPGDGLCLTGPNGAGKTLLLELLAGIGNPDRGQIRLDGSTHQQWEPSKLGKLVGFVTNHPAMMAGTIAQNIARMEEHPDMDELLRVSETCGLHDHVLQLTDGYNTDLGNTNETLSDGLLQRIHIARALYGKPVLLLMDDPSIHLDFEGEKSLVKCLQEHRNNGGTAIVVTQRPHISQVLNKALLINHGSQLRFGNREEIFEIGNVAPLQRRSA